MHLQSIFSCLSALCLYGFCLSIHSLSTCLCVHLISTLSSLSFSILSFSRFLCSLIFPKSTHLSFQWLGLFTADPTRGWSHPSHCLLFQRNDLKEKELSEIQQSCEVSRKHWEKLSQELNIKNEELVEKEKHLKDVESRLDLSLRSTRVIVTSILKTISEWVSGWVGEWVNEWESEWGK